MLGAAQRPRRARTQLVVQGAEIAESTAGSMHFSREGEILIETTDRVPSRLLPRTAITLAQTEDAASWPKCKCQPQVHPRHNS